MLVPDGFKNRRAVLYMDLSLEINFANILYGRSICPQGGDVAAKLVFATRNPGKIRELRALLADKGWEILSMDAFPSMPPVEENGKTFVENALKKARSVAYFTGLTALADDSGLEVDALGGEPGVHSARFGGEGLRDEERNALLLKRLEGVPLKERKARFRCAMAFVTPQGAEYVVEGVCEGLIAQEPKGEGGFGYDPIFYLPSLGKTMAQLPAAEKNRISHRAKAMEKMIEILDNLLNRDL